MTLLDVIKHQHRKFVACFYVYTLSRLVLVKPPSTIGRQTRIIQAVSVLHVTIDAAINNSPPHRTVHAASLALLLYIYSTVLRTCTVRSSRLQRYRAFDWSLTQNPCWPACSSMHDGHKTRSGHAGHGMLSSCWARDPSFTVFIYLFI